MARNGNGAPACVLCQEPVYADDTFSMLEGFLWHANTRGDATNWDACMRAAHGDEPRLIRVHRLFAKDEPLLARAWDGDR